MIDYEWKYNHAERYIRRDKISFLGSVERFIPMREKGLPFGFQLIIDGKLVLIHGFDTKEKAQDYRDSLAMGYTRK